MNDELDPLVTDRQFFSALVDGSVKGLDQVLADDFVLIEVMGGSEVSKSSLIGAIESGQLKFEAIEPADRRLRLYQTTAVVTGRTQMSVRFGETLFPIRSRYTHVYVEQEGRWRLAAAQGTQIAEEPKGE
jgi:ketosteroid isomerase-like protein